MQLRQHSTQRAPSHEKWGLTWFFHENILPWGCPGFNVWSYSMLFAQFLTLCDPMNCSLLVSSVHGILQARILWWVALPSFRASCWPRDWTWISCIAGRFFTIWATWEAHSVKVNGFKNLFTIWATWEAQDSPGEGAWQSTPVFLSGESHEQRSLEGYSPWGCKESDTTEWLTLWRKNLNASRNFLDDRNILKLDRDNEDANSKSLWKSQHCVHTVGDFCGM